MNLDGIFITALLSFTFDRTLTAVTVSVKSPALKMQKP